jgi:monooxygenase
MIEAVSENGDSPPEHLDVLIVGAGLSGIGAACHLTTECPQKSFAILEARDSIGGTWDLFRYPGIRSDSDMFTLGYTFRPWPNPQAIAAGPAIRSYVEDTARVYGVDDSIRFRHRVVRAEWRSEEARWHVDVERTDTGETVSLTCSFLFACTGYYRYDEGFLPHFEGKERFQGTIVHPQHWPEDLDYSGKRVVVIGSGATAVTLVPAMAKDAEHVTMLQRSPSYVVSLPGRDPVAAFAQRFLPAKQAHTVAKWKAVLLQRASYTLSRRRPELMKRLIRAGVKSRLPQDFAIDPHFSPSYNPWDQRLCLVPDGDLFDALARGDASVVTDRIETFTEKGLLLESGEELEADIVITATGLNVLLLGGMDLTVDGEDVNFADLVAYKGFMFSGLPNLALALGYTNASWTLKCDLISEYVCRLLNHMDEHGYAVCTPREPDPSVGREPILDLQSGYVMRVLDELPKQGGRIPWRLHQNYPRDIRMLRHGPVEDEGVEFTRAPVGAHRASAPAGL